MKKLLVATVLLTAINAFAQEQQVRIDIEKKAEHKVDIFKGYVGLNSPFVISYTTLFTNPSALEVDYDTGDQQFIYEQVSVGSVISLEEISKQHYSLTVENLIKINQPIPEETLFLRKHSIQRSITLQPYKTEKVHIDKNISMKITLL